MVDFFVPLVALLGVALGAPTIYFKEEFDDLWTERWVKSQHLGPNQGQFKLGLGKYYADPMKDRGLQTADNSHFYGISAKFDKFSNERKTLVIQYTVKNEQFIECGGMYLKVYSSELNQTDLYSETPYLIMFGPDIRGSDKKVHVIFNYKGKNLAIKKTIKCKFDELTHMYTLVVRPDNTYEVLIDHRRTESGELEADWDFLPPKKITQPKPDDWDDREMIEDPWVKKPADFEKPREIPDPDARKPRDWDDEKQGEWKAPMISNPDYEGEWRQPQIKNPNYMGEWVGKEIDNPDYAPDDKLYVYPDIGAVGIDIWQVKGGSVFDNILITDDANYAKVHGIDTWGQRRDPENRMKARLEDEAAWEKYRAEKKKARQTEARRRGIREEDLPDEYADQEYMPEEEEARPHAPGREGLADVRKRAAEREKKEQAKKHERMHDEL